MLESFQSHSPAVAAAYVGRALVLRSGPALCLDEVLGWSLSCTEWRWRNGASAVGWEVTFVPFSL